MVLTEIDFSNVMSTEQKRLSAWVTRRFLGTVSVLTGLSLARAAPRNVPDFNCGLKTQSEIKPASSVERALAPRQLSGRATVAMSAVYNMTSS